MAFAVTDYDSIKSGVLGTSHESGRYVILAVKQNSKIKLIENVNWFNLGNYSTSGTSGTSGTGGTTIIAAGNYTWIG